MPADSHIHVTCWGGEEEEEEEEECHTFRRMLGTQTATHGTAAEPKMIGWACSMRRNMVKANRVLVFYVTGHFGDAGLFTV